MFEHPVQKKILVVDDHEPICLLYQQELEEDGYEVATATNAKDAFNILDKDAIDLVIMDIKMPGMNGIEALQKIVGKERGIPVIINSCYHRFQENYLTWLADGYVMKSTDLGELKGTIKNILGTSVDAAALMN